MTDTLLYALHTLRFVFAGILVVASLFLLSFLISSMGTGSAQARGDYPDVQIIRMSDSPNAVTGGMVDAINTSGQALSTAGYAIADGVQSAASAVTQTGISIARGAQNATIAAVSTAGNGLAFTGRMAGAGVSFVGHAIGSGISFVLSIPGKVVGFVSNTPIVSALIRPSDHVEVPIIDPGSTELQTAIAALPPAQTSPTAQGGSGPQWPMQGRVTTEFGVGHWPFQRTHTGMDISSGRSSAIRSFRPGRVIDTMHSSRGLGNHVVVDHGNGVTSVYAHLASISVGVGQDVGLDTVLGTEGTTGVSTGTHLHFEIRVHGQAADPRQFIAGQP